jgi:RHS repeat-associated protein
VSLNYLEPGAPVGENFQHDLDGNLVRDGRWTYTWDAENRLVKMESFANAPTGSRRRFDFAYDHQGRRIWKKVTNLDTSAVTSERKFLYDGWNLIAELNESNSVLRKYVWGLDLSGSSEGAGGVGGLLQIEDSALVSHFCAYDGNGNIVGLVKSDGSMSAQYEYGPFGEIIRATGPMAKANPIRFSTKYQDDETDLLNYGYRYYSSATGRWVSRDPIGERGGLCIYGFVRNDAICRIDLLGNQECCGPREPHKPSDPLDICAAGPPAPPKPGDKDRMHPDPDWFKNPPDEGKPCCCTPAAKLLRFYRTDPPPTIGEKDSAGRKWTINMSVDIRLEGCYKDLAILWWTCLREGNQDSGVISWCLNSPSCTFTTHTTNTGGPYLTFVRMRYLSCEDGKWVKKLRKGAGIQYTWEKGKWVQNLNAGSNIP